MLDPLQLLPTSISIPGDDGCEVTVEWSEPVISCGGSVSQYVLSVTPPTPDYQPDSDFRTNETQFNLTVSVDVTYTLTELMIAVEIQGQDSLWTLPLEVHCMYIHGTP